MSSPHNLALLPAFSVLILSSLFHLFIAPYTKVEESFTLHAVWDILTHGRNITNYDHWEFPGAVKRSFIPPFLLSCLAYPFTLFPEVNTQFAVRLALLAVCQLHFHAFARKVASLYGLAAANFFLLFTAAQFHLQFYLSRTLPNFLALPIVVIGLAQLLAADIPTTSTNSSTRRLQLGIGLLISAGIIARSEIAVLCGLTIIVDLILSPSPARYLRTILPVAIVSGIVSTAATVAVDTQLWSCPSFPEFEALLFNVIGGHASEWGVEPWHYYIVSLPKLLLNPLAPMLIASTVVITWYTSVSLMDAVRQLRYIIIIPILYILGFSYLSHKEWRFIIYVIPLLTTAASISAAYIHHQRVKSIFYRLIHILLLLSVFGSIILSFTMGIASSTNYPGAMALESLHTLCNSSNAKVYLDIPTRMTGATLPLCNRQGWTYVKTENTTLLHSTEYWKDVDYAIVGSLADVPCKRGKGVEGKGEWEVIYRQKGYSGIIWKPFEVPHTLWNNTYINDLRSNEDLQKFVEKAKNVRKRVVDVASTTVDKITSNGHIKGLMGRIGKVRMEVLEVVAPYVSKVTSNNHVRRTWDKVEDIVGRIDGVKVPWVRLEDQIFVLKHMRKKDLLERKRILEEKMEKERQGLGIQGEVEGQWREFY